MAGVIGRLLAGAMILAVLLTACSSSPSGPVSTAAAAGPGGSARVRILTWNSLDPFNLLNAGAGLAAEAIYDRLVALDGAKVVPYLASSWTETPTKITFKLRDDATCSDGEKVTPTVVLNHFKRMFDTAKPSPAGLARQFGPGPYTLTADDASSTFTFSTAMPSTVALRGFTGASVGSIVCTAGTNNPGSLDAKPVGSGPYVLDSSVPGDFLKLTLRPEWRWGARGVTAKTAGIPREITFRVIDNETTAANLLISGGMDVAAVRGPDVARLLTDQSLKMEVAPTYSIDWMLFQQGPGAVTQDENVREALMTAVDPKAWNDAANDGRGALSSSFVTPNGDCYEPETAKLVPTPSVDKARAVLLSHGYTQDASGKILKDGKPLVIRLLTRPDQGLGPDYVFSQFSKVGLTVNYQKLDTAAYLVRSRASDYDVVIQFVTSTIESYGSVGVFSGPLPPAGTNFPKIVDPTLEMLVATARSTVGDERCAAWKSVQRRVIEKHYLLPLAGSPDLYFRRPGFQFEADPLSLRSPVG